MRAPFVGKRRGSAPLAVAMTPMIDVVFLLLVFFLCTATFERPEEDLAASLSVDASATGVGESTTPREILDELKIVGARRGDSTVWTVNGSRSVRAGEELTRLLSDLAEIDPATPVTLEPGPDVPFADAVAAYDSARAAGLGRVLLTAREDAR